MVIVLFLEEQVKGTGVFKMADQIVSGYEPFIENLDKYITRLVKEEVKKVKA
jgi:hypothetical protein